MLNPAGTAEPSRRGVPVWRARGTAGRILASGDSVMSQETNATPAQISKAIEDHYALWWTAEMEQAILADVGTEGLAQVKEISSFANAPEHWVYEPHDRAYSNVQSLLHEKYPFLSAAAVQRIATSAAYGWK